MPSKNCRTLTTQSARKGPWRTVQRVAVAGIIGLFACACSSHVRVVKVTDAPVEGAGVYYALPMTEVVTEITVEAVEKEPGPKPGLGRTDLRRREPDY